MKKEKKGFTLVEIIVCLGILVVIAGIFSINFIKNLRFSREEEYRTIIQKLKTATDAYVTMHRESLTDDYEDIKLVISNDKTFTYITLNELESDGLINRQNAINPITGKQLKGIVKFSKENDVLDYEYIENPKDFITIIYDRNGADSISRTARAFYCENGDAATCVDDELLPSITREGGRIFGWSIGLNDKTSAYKPGTSLKTLLSSSKYKIEDSKVRLYAITSLDVSIFFEDPYGGIKIPTSRSCTIYNMTPTCNVELPDYAVDEYHNKLGWNTNIDGSGYNYKVKTDFAIGKNLTLYLEKEVKPFNIKINKLRRTSGTTVVPSNINLIFVLDISGSMSSGRLSNLKTVTTGLVDSMNFDNSTVSLVTFASGSSTILNFEKDRLRVKSEINRLTAGGGTNFYSAILSAADVVDSSTNNKSNFVLLVSDGYPTEDINPSSPILTNLKNKATIYTIGIGADHDSSYMRALASKSETYYAYDEYTDDRSLSKFYAIFKDIVEKITILEGDGEENAIPSTVFKGKLELGALVISEKYPLTVYLNNNLLDTFISENEYFYQKNGKYYFDIYNYSLNKSSVGLQNMSNLRIKFFYKEDGRKR